MRIILHFYKHLYFKLKSDHFFPVNTFFFFFESKVSLITCNYNPARVPLKYRRCVQHPFSLAPSWERSLEVGWGSYGVGVKGSVVNEV